MTTVGNIDKYHAKITFYEIYCCNKSFSRIQCIYDKIQQSYWEISVMGGEDGNCDPVNCFYWISHLK